MRQDTGPIHNECIFGVEKSPIVSQYITHRSLRKGRSDINIDHLTGIARQDKPMDKVGGGQHGNRKDLDLDNK